MPKVIAPFKIIGTIDALNFYIDQNNENIVRTKGKTGVSSEEFRRNPIFTKVKNHSKEFTRAVKKAATFRMLAHPFNQRAKDGSFAGRANKLILEIIQEDKVNNHGERTFEEGMKNREAKNFFVGFEGNKLKPLKSVLKTEWTYEEKTNHFTIENFNLLYHLEWPEAANQVHIAIAVAQWNYLENNFNTVYSEEVIIAKEDQTSNLLLNTNTTYHPEQNSKQTTENSQPITENQLHLTYLFIGFSTLDRKKTKELKRSNNTVSIIWSK